MKAKKYKDGGVMEVLGDAAAAGGKKLVDTVSPAVKAVWPYVEKGVEVASPYVKKANDAIDSVIPRKWTGPGLLEDALEVERLKREREQKLKKFADGGLVHGDRYYGKKPR